MKSLLRGLAVLVVLVTLVAVAANLYLRRRAHRHLRQMEVAAERELLGGGLRGLLRARAMALGGAAVAADDNAAATVALASAILASDYGLDERDAALFAADAVAAAPHASPRAQALRLASQALVELGAGNTARAEALVRESLALGHKQSSPLFALGRVRMRQGNLEAASHALQAALVREPELMEARVAAAEASIELGQPAKANELLALVLRRTPDHGRAALLMAESEALVGDVTIAWEPACARDATLSPFIASACELVRAEQAWRQHDRQAAIGLAIAAAERRPAEPRALGRAAQLLASLGAVDAAARYLHEALRTGSPTLPSLRWAKIAVELGRGELANPPKDVAPASTRWAPWLLARIALVSGGPKALAAALRAGNDTVRELGPLASTVSEAGGDSAPAEDALTDPIAAYVHGVEARLAGKPVLAAAWLRHALHGHGDACRAAGEYVAVSRELGQTPGQDAFAELAAENSGCINLSAALASATEPVGRKLRGRATARH